MPGTQPQRVRTKTMSIDPQPRSITASGGKIMERITWRQDIFSLFHFIKKKSKRLIRGVVTD